MTEQEIREKVINGLKSYAEELAYAEKMMAEGVGLAGWALSRRRDSVSCLVWSKEQDAV